MSTTAVMSLVPEPQFPRKAPAGRQSNRPDPIPGGQPDSTGVPATTPAPVAARWTRCPIDGQLHLLAPMDVPTAAGGQVDAYALCGRRICAGKPTLRGPSQGLCMSCLAAGSAP